MPQSATLVNLWRHDHVGSGQDKDFNRNTSSLNLSAGPSPVLVRSLHRDLVVDIEDQSKRKAALGMKKYLLSSQHVMQRKSGVVNAHRVLQ